MEVLDKLQELFKGSAYQKEFERKASLWESVLADPKFKVLLEHIQEEIDALHETLEHKDDVDARAEIRVYRKILQVADTYSIIKNDN